jgi:hypothetical protein
MNCLRPLERWDSGFESQSRYGCLFVFILFVLGSGLATGWSLVQGVLPNVLHWETQVQRSVSRMPYAPSGSNRNKPTNQRGCANIRDYTMLNYMGIWLSGFQRIGHGILYGSTPNIIYIFWEPRNISLSLIVIRTGYRSQRYRYTHLLKM